MIDDWFDRTCTIERWNERKPGADFVVRPDWQTVATNVPCNLQDGKVQQVPTAAGVQMVFHAVAFFEPETDIRPAPGDEQRGDRLTFGDDSVYHVVGVARVPGTYLKAFLKRV